MADLLTNVRSGWYCSNNSAWENQTYFLSQYAVPECAVLGFHIAVGLPGLMLNTLLLATIFYTQKLRSKPIHTLVSGLVFNDLITCSVIAFATVYIAYNPAFLTTSKYSCQLCFIVGLFMTLICTCSGNMLMLIAIERYLCGFLTDSHKRYFSIGATRWQTGSSWLIQIFGNVVFAFFGFIGYRPFPRIRFCLIYVKSNVELLTGLVIFAFTCVFLVSLYCYARMYLGRKSVQTKNLGLLQQWFVFACYFLTWTPVVLFVKTPWSVATEPVLALCFFSALFVSAEVKPIIYFMMDPEYRRSAVKMVAKAGYKIHPQFSHH